MSKHCVYWYHLETHTDLFSEGYVGVTNDMTRRHNEHMRNSNNLVNHFYNAIKHYGKDTIKCTILHDNLSAQEAYELEYFYRPEPNIGWNYAIGGNDTLETVQSRPVTLFHVSNPNKEYSFKSITEAAKELGISAGRIQQAVIRKYNTYGRDGWTVVTENTDKSTIKTCNQAASERLKDIPKWYTNKWKGCTNRWSEEERKRIGLQHRGKKLSAKHIAKLKEINRHNASCKSITLAHNSDPKKLYTFFSVSEASRQLGLPLPRLKSKCTRTLGTYGKDGWAVIALGSQDSSNE